ncbi:type VII secretion target [Pseudonocardia endophytica]|uniref:Excreted virulence factor EspC (Type VII ESX diderm) n=1 Tax=Pseudonocardia endophytica TaxID=401976 RepID=A0A4R1HH90_PSEEN|nr:hypothetical protein [Pseudonocardia endophytica]TCK20143.1 hypothetical protein EV378_4092 [Pseudonocardia endophytica]
MTASGYRAAPAAMRDAADGIDGLVGELGTLTTAGRAGAGRGVAALELDPDQVGHDELAAAFATFCERWEWGVRALVQSGTEMAEGLRESSKAYENADAETGSLFSRLLSDAVGDPRADPEQAARRTPEEILRDDSPDSSWSDAGRSMADTWSAVGKDVLDTGTDRVLRWADGENPYAPELDALHEIVE